MTAMMTDDGKRVAAGGARLQWHMIPIADIDLIARNTRGEENEENGVASLREQAGAVTPSKKQTLKFEFRRLLTHVLPPISLRSAWFAAQRRSASPTGRKRKLRDRLVISSKERKREVRDHEE
jgi:hypothetical protein